MEQKIAIAIIHGIGKHIIDDPSHALIEEFIRKLKLQLQKLVPDVDANSALAFETIWWSVESGLQAEQNRLWQLMREAGYGLNPIREFLAEAAGDIVAYQPNPRYRATYDEIHATLARGFNRLAKAAGENAPLIIVAHSMGTVIVSDYIYDVCEDPKRPAHQKLISEKVASCINSAPLEMMKTLAYLFTLGSPLALWSLRYRDFGSPIEIPSPALDEYYPALDGKWINFFDRHDWIAFPLQPLNDAYLNAVADHEVNIGGIFQSWNPTSHFGYWKDDDVIKPIAECLADIWHALQPQKTNSRTIYGVDFSGGKDAGAKIWVTEAEHSTNQLQIRGSARIADLPDGSKDRSKALTALREFIISKPNAIFGLDFPFGLPQQLTSHKTWEEFARNFTQDYASPENFREQCHTIAGGKELKRATDREARTPFCVYNIRLYRQTYYGIGEIIAPLIQDDLIRVLPMQSPHPDKPILIEICPASALKQMNLYKPYKGKTEAHRKTREFLIQLLETAHNLNISDEIRKKYMNDTEGDALDSLIAALATFQALQSNPDLSVDGAQHSIEGYVYL